MENDIEVALKRIITFNPENDFSDRDKRENLANTFSQIISSDSDGSLEFVNALIPVVGDIMDSLGIGVSEPSEDDVEVDEEPKADEETEDEVSPEEAALENNNIDAKLVENANNYIYL